MGTRVTARVFELLAEARRALALRGRLRGAGRDVSAVDAALEGLYRDLGHAVVNAAEARDGLAFPTIHRVELVDYEIDRDDPLGWVEEEQDEPTTPGPTLVEPVFEPHELDDTTSVPVSDLFGTPVIPVEREISDTEGRAPDFRVTTLERAVETARDPLSALVALRSDPAWKPRVLELVTLLSLPADTNDPDELRVEASRLQWATSALDHRLHGLPVEIQAVFVGLLAARAQHLRGRLDHDVAPRIVIDRLQRYRVSAQLPTVPALLPTARPERSSWADDARGWWALLVPSLAAGSSSEGTWAPGSG